MKVELLFPPLFKASEPYIALPLLVGFLREHGVPDVQARDLNLEYVYHLMEDATLAEAGRELRGRAPAGTWLDDAERALVSAAITHVPVLRRWLPESLGLYKAHRDPEALRAMPRQQAQRQAAQFELVFEMLFEVYTALHYPWRLENPITRREAVLSNEAWTMDESNNVPWRDCLAWDHPRNPFRAFFESSVAPGLVERRPSVVGISLMFRQQLLAAFTLAAVVRRALPEAHICLGGALFSDLEHYLFTAPAVRDAVFQHVDSVVLGPGEVPLHGLIQALRAGTPVEGVSNVLTRAGVERDTNADAAGSIEEMSGFEAAGRESTELGRFATPVFFDGRLDRYLYRTPELTIPYLTSYGCYWNKCSFCKYREQVHRYSPKPVDTVVDDLRALSLLHGSRRFHFSDETLSPSYCKRMSSRLIEIGSPFAWSGNARFDPGFTEELASAMRQSGCEYISFGLESGSQRIVDRMGKGTRSEVVERTMEAFRAAGLPVNLYLFVGFPGETEEDIALTVAFLRRHRGTITDLSVGPFTLYKGTGVFRDPARYGIRNVEQGELQDPDVLRWVYHYELAEETGGLMPDEAMTKYLVHHRDLFGQMGEGLSPDGTW